MVSVSQAAALALVCLLLMGCEPAPRTLPALSDVERISVSRVENRNQLTGDITDKREIYQIMKLINERRSGLWQAKYMMNGSCMNLLSFYVKGQVVSTVWYSLNANVDTWLSMSDRDNSAPMGRSYEQRIKPEFSQKLSDTIGWERIVSCRS
jgi:hypothetical protein